MSLKTVEIAKQVRKDIIEMTYKAGSIGTHIGGSLSLVEILSVLYNDILKFDINNLENEQRDRLIISKGHGAMAMYAVMHRVGILTEEEIATFKKDGSSFATHPSLNVKRGIEFSSGSLGHGLSLGVGSALALKRKNNLSSKVVVILGDGECDEGSVWEAAMSAVHYKLDNIIAIVDENKLQLDGATKEIMNTESLEEKWKSFGWNTLSVDGHDINELENTFRNVYDNSKSPTVIFAKTIKGKGISFIENQYNWHVGVLNTELYNQAKEELEGV